MWILFNILFIIDKTWLRAAKRAAADSESQSPLRFLSLCGEISDKSQDMSFAIPDLAWKSTVQHV